MCIFNQIRLNEAIQQRGAEQSQSELENLFRCNKNSDVEHFFLKNAVRFEQAKMTKNHLILDEESQHILAYYSLSFKSIKVMVSKNRLKKLTGGLTNSNKINVFLIAQIGKNSLIE